MADLLQSTDEMALALDGQIARCYSNLALYLVLAVALLAAVVYMLFNIYSTIVAYLRLRAYAAGQEPNRSVQGSSAARQVVHVTAAMPRRPQTKRGAVGKAKAKAKPKPKAKPRKRKA